MPTNARARAAGAVAVVLTGVAAAGCASPRSAAPPGAALPGAVAARGAHRARCGGPDDSVQVGYGAQRRCDVTSAVGSSERGAWEGQQMATMADLLRARIPGLDVQTGANGLLTLRVRGAASILGSSEPLLVIDGMPVDGPVGSALAALVPRDVARVDVLKDASAAAIYGSRSANGVVLITTRRR